jgi:hypothetical protein
VDNIEALSVCGVIRSFEVDVEEEVALKGMIGCVLLVKPDHFSVSVVSDHSTNHSLHRLDVGC